VRSKEGRDDDRGMTARVCTPPMIIDRVTPNVSTTADALGESILPSPRSSATTPEPEMMLFGRRCGSTVTGTSESLPQVTRHRNVSRNLFGVPSPTSAQYARDKLRELLKKDSERWNFDFESEKPLPGRWVIPLQFLLHFLSMQLV